MILLVIKEEDLEYNEDGESVGYKGEGWTLLMGIIVGACIGLALGGLFITSPYATVTETNTTLPNAGQACGAESGTPADNLSITCHPKDDGTGTRCYFDVNMTVIDTEVTALQ